MRSLVWRPCRDPCQTPEGTKRDRRLPVPFAVQSKGAPIDIPHFMRLGFIHRETQDGGMVRLNNTEDSLTLKLDMPITF